MKSPTTTEESKMTYSLIAHEPSGELYAVEVDPSGQILAAAGPLHYSDPLDDEALAAWISNNPDAIADGEWLQNEAEGALREMPRVSTGSTTKSSSVTIEQIIRDNEEDPQALRDMFATQPRGMAPVYGPYPDLRIVDDEGCEITVAGALRELDLNYLG